LRSLAQNRADPSELFRSFILCLFLAYIPTAIAISEAEIEQILSKKKIDIERIKSHGPSAIPPLVKIYERSAEDRRARIAWVFYQLSIKSPEAKRVLMKDVHTKHTGLRLQAQWALGRVSNDDDVVQTLLQNMQHDPNHLFRDKAACALASDQVHLAPRQKVKLYQGLIEALGSPKPQVRKIAIQALNIQTGQTKGFRAASYPEDRQKAIEKWQAWLAEYKRNL
jgi:HEAT repeat protein